MAHSHSHGENVVVVADQAGMTIVPSPSPLTSLNFFDGKFLRAADLLLEKRYMRRLVELSNQGLGSGVVHGIDTTLTGGDAIRLGAGMAIDPLGRLLLLPTETLVPIDALLESSRRTAASRAGLREKGMALASSRVAINNPSAGFDDCEDVLETPPSGTAHANDLYLISIAHAEALCGHEDVFGRLCDDACVTRTDRPFRVEGIVVRATPLELRSPLPDSGTVAVDRRHLRSRVASAFFADEAVRVGSLVSRAGLAADTWCLGARLEGGSDVPIAVLARSGATTVYLDAWTARRERMDAPARRYWARRMAMRPWDVYLAHILQFQCQLHDLLGATGEPGADDDPCRPEHSVLADTAKVLEDFESHYVELLGTALASAAPRASAGVAELGKLPGGLARIAELRERIQGALDTAFTGATNRVLIDGGILETPSAGYLPVVPGSGITVNEQVRRLMGEGVDLRFCVVRADYVPHALEEAQHMERISLIAGLDRPEAKPRVDVLVPDGVIETVTRTPTGMGFAMTVDLNLGDPDPGIVENVPMMVALPESRLRAPRLAARRLVLNRASSAKLHGAGRGEIQPSGRMAFYMAGATEVPRGFRAADLIRGVLRREVDGQSTNELLADLPTRRGVEHAGDLEAPLLASRLRTIGASAADHLRVARRAGEFVADAERPEPFRAPLGPGDKRLVCLWLSMAIDDDLRTIEPNTAVPVRFDARLVAPSGTTVAQRMFIRGDFEISGIAPTPNGRKLTGISSLNWTHHDIESGAAVDVDSGHVDAKTIVELDLRSTVPTLSIQLGVSEGDGQLVEATWEIGPFSAEVELTSLQRSGRQGLAHASALEDASALTPGSQPHGFAWSAIDTIAAAFSEPAFADAARKALFAQEGATQRDLVVRATRDWVLFHRRRDITCDVETEAPVISPPRRYQVFTQRVENERELTAIVQRLRDADPAAIRGLEPVDIVTFAGGQPTLSTPPSAVLADWQGRPRGDRIRYSYIASGVPGDGDLLAGGRLDHLLDVVVPVTPLHPGAVRDVVSGVPAGLVVQGTDGAIVLLTMDIATACARIVRLEGMDPTAEPKASTVDGNVQVEWGESSRMLDLGDITFDEDQPDIREGGEAVAQRWRGFDDGPADRIIIVSGAGSNPPAGAELSARRADSVAALLGIRPRTVRPFEMAEPLTECPTTIVVVAQPALDCQRVYRVTSRDVWGKLIELNAIDDVESLLADAVQARLADELGEARFVSASAQLANPGPLRLRWNTLGSTEVESTHVISLFTDPEAGDDALRSARAQSIHAALGVGRGINLQQVEGQALKPCHAIVALFVPEARVSSECYDVYRASNPDTFGLLENTRDPAVIDEIVRQRAVGLGTARFSAGREDFDPFPQEIADRWAAEGGGDVKGVVVFFRDGDVTVGDDNLRPGRYNQVFHAIGAGADVREIRLEEPLIGECGAVMVLLPSLG
jgi:hypothetical protein